MTPNADRAAVAREVLTELLEFANARAETVSDAKQFMRERYPVPPAPETVTVGAVNTLRTGTANTLAVTVGDRAWTLEVDGRWRWGSLVVERSNWAHDMLDRIASDARVIAERDARIAELEKANAQYLVELNAFNTRIAELDKDRAALLACVNNQLYNITTLIAERDAALRALEEAKNRPCPCAVASKTLEDETSQGEEPECPAAAARLAATAPAPIPLGATVEVEGDRIAPFTRRAGYWADSLGNTWADDGGLGCLIAALYHARHPVASRAMVERVAALLDKRCLSSMTWEQRAEELAREFGFTVEEGA